MRGGVELRRKGGRSAPAIPDFSLKFNQLDLQDRTSPKAGERRGKMQFTHDFDTEQALPVGWRVRVLVLAASEGDALVPRVAALGGPVEVETELYAALAALIDDPSGYGLFVMDCDAFGGAEAAALARRTLAAVQSRVPVILLCAAHARHDFPQERAVPVTLRAPVSAVSLRVGFEHALRDRLAWRAA
jgi:hypothetical protein